MKSRPDFWARAGMSYRDRGLYNANSDVNKLKP